MSLTYLTASPNWLDLLPFQPMLRCNTNYPYFFLRKNHDWEAETEYRWLVYGKEHAPEFIPIEGAIKSVLVGVDFPDR